MTETATFSGHSLAAARGGRPVFAGLDFSVQAGEALRLAGPNGSGKSTLMRLMAGLGRPSLGSLAWNAQNIEDEPSLHCERLAYLGHADGLKPVMNVRDNLRHGLKVQARGLERVEHALETLGLASMADLPVGWLSSGQRRRAALARVIASGAKLWLLDEPTVGLDDRSVTALQGAISAHLVQGGMVVAATHIAIDLGSRVQTLDPAEFAPDLDALALDEEPRQW